MGFGRLHWYLGMLHKIIAIDLKGNHINSWFFAIIPLYLHLYHCPAFSYPCSASFQVSFLTLPEKKLSLQQKKIYSKKDMKYKQILSMIPWPWLKDLCQKWKVKLFLLKKVY